jgi:surfactin synthase thioesterase subunit
MAAGSGELVAETPYLWRVRRVSARHRLICFPHAGAGATAYADWPSLLPPEIELVAVQLPGRQNRIGEEPPTEVASLVRTLTYALRPVLGGAFSFFGHSGGASLAFEVARNLLTRGMPQPEQLFLASEMAPEHAARRRWLHELPDEELGEEVIRLGGVNPEVAGNPMALAELLAPVRADFRLWERYRPLPGPLLGSAITVLVGDVDPVISQRGAAAWESRTTGVFDLRTFPGGHFFFHHAPGELVEFIGQRIMGGAA